jgi:16S rRNA pseudouridine516 synthase
MSNIRLDKLLSNLGYCSRKEAAALVKEGRLILAGDRVKRADQSIALADVKNGALTLDGEILDPPPPLTVMLNKPAGYSCSHDEKGMLIYDLLPPRWQQRKPALSSIGRLDKESTGQLLLTDDGDLLHKVIHPKSHAAKQYEVTLAQPLRGDEKALFATGSFLMAGDTKPLKPAIWEPKSENAGRMVLHEGRYHQIRRMFETIGNKVTQLHRTQTGGLTLGDLAEGKYMVLCDEELSRIFSAD